MVQFTTISEILDAVEEQGIDFAKFRFSDTSGMFNEIDVPASLLESAFTKGLPFDNSAGGTFKPTGSDLMLKPDPRTFTIMEKDEGDKFGSVICELTFLDGQPFDGCVRTALKLFVRKIFQSGYTFTVSSSISFYLLDCETVSSLMSPSVKSSQKLLFDSKTLDQVEKIKKDILASLKQAEIDIISMRQTRLDGPITVTFKEGSVLRVADNIMILKSLIIGAARNRGLRASFMPLPLSEADGLSANFGFILMKNEFNEFYHPDQDMMISDKARGFIGGIFKHIRGICVVTNPTVNSYKRIVQKRKAPYYISWSAIDRNSLIRLPSPRGRSTKIEVQNADSSCNPYLSLLALLSAGISGMDENLVPIPAANFETHDYSESEKQSLSAGTLPDTLFEAIESFKGDALLKEAFGEAVSLTLIQKESAEWNEYIGLVHLWELEKYL
ncbi:MAG: glutamine synthetase family protein [Methanimicrococcus sp.]|nr:glutamine synthetase family protein [Methanimicrococcus sp.]